MTIALVYAWRLHSQKTLTYLEPVLRGVLNKKTRVHHAPIIALKIVQILVDMIQKMNAAKHAE